MIPFLAKIKRKRNIINIRRKRKKLKKRRYAAQNQKQNSNNAVFEIKNAFRVDEKDTIICGKVKSGSFKTKDYLDIFDMHGNKLKFKAVIKKITTTLVEVNKINCGFETDMLISNVTDIENEICPGDIAFKVLIFKSCK